MKNEQPQVFEAAHFFYGRLHSGLAVLNSYLSQLIRHKDCQS